MRQLFKLILISFIAALIILPTLVTIVIGNYVINLQKASGLTVSYITKVIVTAYKSYSSQPPLSFLVLGLDQRSDSLEQTLLTDAIIVGHYSPTNATATLVPIPRDLWLPSLRAKVNALFYYGKENGQGLDFVITNLKDLTGQSLNKYIVLDYNHFPALINILGGVDIDVPNSFTDDQFPNPDYITNSKAPIYTTVSFTKGISHMDGITALNFARSRNSKDPTEGSDLARSRRQLLLIDAMAKKILTPKFFQSPSLVGQTYRYIRSSINTNISDAEILALIFATYPNTKLTVNSHTLTDQILANPPVSKYNQWVLEERKPGNIKLFFTSLFP